MGWGEDRAGIMRQCGNNAMDWVFRKRWGGGMNYVNMVIAIRRGEMAQGDEWVIIWESSEPESISLVQI